MEDDCKQKPSSPSLLIPWEIYCQGPAMTRLQKPKHLQIELQLTDTLEQETFPIQNFSPHPKEHHIEPKENLQDHTHESS